MRARIAMMGLMLAACGGVPAVQEGEQLFSDPAFSRATSNVFSCATCHEATKAPAAIRPGYVLAGAVLRPTYWGGVVGTLLSATNQCLVDFMRDRPISAEDERGRALLVYLESLPGEETGSLPLSVVANIVDVPSGDAARGEAIYAQACVRCHGAPSTGEGRISAKQSIIPDETIKQHGATGSPRLSTIEKVRHGKYFGIGTDMPLFSLEALSDQQLGDVLAFLERYGLPATP